MCTDLVWSQSCRWLNHLDEKSPFRPCGSDLVEFFNNTGWAFFVQVDYFRVGRQISIATAVSRRPLPEGSISFIGCESRNKVHRPSQANTFVNTRRLAVTNPANFLEARLPIIGGTFRRTPED
jgi:hypothetical protein